MERKILPVLLAVGLGMWGLSGRAEEAMAVQAVRELVRLLDDPSAHVREAASQALGSIARAAPHAILELWQGTEDPRLRPLVTVAAYLALPPRSTFDELVRHFIVETNDRDEKFVADLLARLREEVGNAELLARLVEALYHGIWAEKEAALHAFLELAPLWPEAHREVGWALVSADLDLRIRYRLAQGLAQQGVQMLSLVPELLAVIVELKDPYPYESWKIRQALLDLGEGVVPALAEALALPNKAHRLAALDLLANLGEKAKGAVPAVVALLEREHLPEVRKAALSTLGAIGRGDLSAVQALTKVAKGHDPEEISLALEALGTMRSVTPEALNIVFLRVHHPFPSVRASAVRALGRLAAPESAVPLLVQALADPNLAVRATALAALGILGPAAQSAGPAILASLKEPDPAIRKAAALALGGMGPVVPGGFEGLRELLKDPVFEVRLAAIEALGMLGPSAAAVLPELLQLQEEEEKARRLTYYELEQLEKTIEQALGRFGFQALVKLLEELPPEDQHRLHEAVGRLLTEAMEYGLRKLTGELVHPVTIAFRWFLQAMDIEVKEIVHVTPELTLEKEIWIDLQPGAGAIFRALQNAQRSKILWSAFCADMEGIRKALESPSPLVRQEALAYVAGCPEVPPEREVWLRAAARDEAWTVRLAAWTAMLRGGRALPKDLLAAGLKDPHPVVRSLVVLWAFRLIPDPSQKKAILLEALADPEGLVRWSALLGLLVEFREPPKEAVPYLLQMLSGSSPKDLMEESLMELASAALARAKNWEAVPLIFELATQPWAMWNWAPHFVLSWYGDELLPFLAEALAHPEGERREAAMLTLQHMFWWATLSDEGVKNAAAILLRAVHHEDPKVREGTVNILPMVCRRDPSFAESVFEALLGVIQGESTWKAKVEALRALAFHADELRLTQKAPVVMPVLLEFWKREEKLRYFVISVWECLGPAAAEATPLLLAALRSPADVLPDDEPWYIKARLMETLESIKEGAVPYLVEALDDPALQLDIVFMLERMGPSAKDAVPHLLALLDTSDEELKVAVAHALGNILGGRPARKEF